MAQAEAEGCVAVACGCCVWHMEIHVSIVWAMEWAMCISLRINKLLRPFHVILRKRSLFRDHSLHLPPRNSLFTDSSYHSGIILCNRKNKLVSIPCSSLPQIIVP